MSYSSAFFFVPALAAFALAIAVNFREAKNMAHRFFLLGVLLLSIETVCAGFSAIALIGQERISFQRVGLAIAAFLPVSWLAFSVVYSRGNKGVFLKAWIPALLGFLIAPIVIEAAFWPEIVRDEARLETGELVQVLGWPGVVLQVLILSGSILALMNIERTFKASVGTMRWKIKYMLLGVACIFGARIYTTSQVILFRWISPHLQLIDAIGLFCGCVLFLRGASRAGMFKVEVYPSEKLLQSSITGVFAGAYLLVIGLFARLVTWLGGTEAFPLKALAITLSLAGLAVLFLSERLRQQLHDFLARNLGRPRYDYRIAWLNLTERTASILDPEELARTVANSISETLRALSVTIWVRDEQSGQLKQNASTCFSETISPASAGDQHTLMEELKKQVDPFIVDPQQPGWLGTLRGYYADYFKTGGSRVCVPLLARGKLVGMITLGDRVNAAPYGTEELDLLKCIGDQFASSLLNLELSKELVQAKEMEAFQTISAFFVHDLKNTASTLSLMLQNFRAHIDNPAFREDALRAIAKSTSHIQELIQRLSMVRQRLDLRTRPVDLNKLLKDSIECLKGRPELEVIQEFGDVPETQADPEQLNKVLTNLLLNAAEAVSNRGEVRLRSAQQNGWVVLSVSDNGCGMSPEFIKKSLFRPFQSTKKGGLGIGMFHTRMIVEAHQGRIEVESQPGRGTSFRVLLPSGRAQKN